MYLLIDAGNTRIKFGCHDGARWVLRSTVTPDMAGFPLPDGFRPVRIVVANVAGELTQQWLQRILPETPSPIEWLRATPLRCGLKCAYDPPARLGPDRWAAAIGAWATVRKDCLVVSAGTATTIDIVRQPGVFAGGCILPGFDMMRHALARETAALPLATGELVIPPVNTDDAIVSGCWLAQRGAILQMYAHLPPKSPILIAGGHAETLVTLIGEPASAHAWLVLDGLLEVARTSSPSTEGDPA